MKGAVILKQQITLLVGNPAAIVTCTLGPWLCVPTFQWVCPFIANAGRILSKKGRYGETYFDYSTPFRIVKRKHVNIS